MAIKISKDEYIKKFGQDPFSSNAVQQQGSQENNGFVKNVVAGVARPFAEAGTSFVNLGEAIAGVPENQFSHPFSGKFLGDVNRIGAGFDITKGLTPENISAVKNAAKTGLDIALTTEIPGLSGKGIIKAAESTAPTIRGAGRLLKSAGEGSYGITITPEETTRRALNTYKANQGTWLQRMKGLIKGESIGEKPITEAETAARQGLYGTEQELGVQAKRASDRLWNENIAPELNKVKKAIDMKNFLNETERVIKKSEGDITRRNALLDAMQQVKQDYKNVGKVNLTKLQDYKSEWAKFLPESSYSGKPIAGALKEVHKIMADNARKVIYGYVGKAGKQAYLDYGNLQSIIEAGIKAGGDPAKKSLSKNVWEFAMNKVVTPVATIGGKVLYKTGEGLEFFGKPGAKKVKDVLVK